MGKLIEESRAEVQLTADILSYYAKNAKTFLAQEQLKQQEGPTAVISQSIAICLAIQELINKRLVRTQAADSTNP